MKKKFYIASISVRGEIFEDSFREQKLALIAKDPKIKAVILDISSPGGTTYGGESLYHSILEISKKKPVVAVMGTLATSAGYMVSLAADQIIARNSTITASIGTIFISPEFSGLAKKLGVDFIVLKKGKFKADPLPFQGPISKEAKQMLNSLLEDQYDMFIDMVSKRRNIPKNKLQQIADGRIVTGAQAFNLGLVDQIGARQEALKWLSSRGINVKKLKVKEISLVKQEGIKAILASSDLKSMITDFKSFFRLFKNFFTANKIA